MEVDESVLKNVSFEHTMATCDQGRLVYFESLGMKIFGITHCHSVYFVWQFHVFCCRLVKFLKFWFILPRKIFQHSIKMPEYLASFLWRQ
jgi:hypothetical protein